VEAHGFVFEQFKVLLLEGLVAKLVDCVWNELEGGVVGGRAALILFGDDFLLQLKVFL
jgi:hypothetical protein